MKLGSLFDGSGGFPLAGSLCGIEPVWAAEVEPYPIAVTRSRFPYMKHLGDVTKVNGAGIEPVDIITFGSPCQDLSVAGKRAGLKHEANGDDETTRSGLFLEAIRIIREMRGATNGVYPRFAVWENVVGAFSSNGGEDFRTVLEEFTKIVEPSASMPAPEKGRWAYADCYVGDGWSVAYRTFDAQYWGVPQRRRRIYLVADFGGGCAEEILFEREGLQGYFETGRTPWEGVAADAERGAYVYDARGNGDGSIVSTLTGDHENRITDYTSVIVSPVYCLQGNGVDRADTAGCNGKCVKEDIRYVRRLTPTECERLQGFPDAYGVPEHKDDFSDEEHEFWLNVRNTYAAINGKAVRQYTKKQMLAWYSKLHTDSAEYKMWGNGIAMPCALYVMQGIQAVLNGG